MSQTANNLSKTYSNPVERKYLSHVWIQTCYSFSEKMKAFDEEIVHQMKKKCLDEKHLLFSPFSDFFFHNFMVSTNSNLFYGEMSISYIGFCPLIRAF